MSELKRQVQELVASRRYAEAIVLLEEENPPGAAAAIARIQAAWEKADKVKPKRAGYDLMLVIFAIVLVVFVGAGVYAIYQDHLRREAYSRELQLQYKISGLCRDIFWDDRYSSGWTDYQFNEGCNSVTEHAIAEFSKEINYCYDHENQTDARFEACLVNNEVKLNSRWISQAPKEEKPEG